MDTNDTARSFFEAARSEALIRAQLRDGAMLAFLAAVAAVFGFALSKEESGIGATDVLLIVPYLAFGASHLVQHNLVFDSLSRYQQDELSSFLKDCECLPPLWENSNALRSRATLLLMLTFVAQVVILGLPRVAALFLAPCHDSGFLHWAKVGRRCSHCFINSRAGLRPLRAPAYQLVK